MDIKGHFYACLKKQIIHIFVTFYPFGLQIFSINGILNAVAIPGCNPAMGVPSRIHLIVVPLNV